MRYITAKLLTDTRVNLWRGIYGNIQSEISLADALLLGRQPNHQDRIEWIRSIQDKAKRDEIKRFLPMWTSAGIFADKSASYLKKWSHLMILDFDEKDHLGSTADDLKIRAAKCPYTVYAGYSVSGRGIFVICWCRPDQVTPRTYGRWLAELTEIYKPFGLYADRCAGGLNRTRFISIDPHPYCNVNAQMFEPAKVPEPVATPVLHKQYRDEWTKLLQKVENVVSASEEKSINIAENQDEWFRVGCALLSGLGSYGKDYFLRISRVWETTGHKHQISPKRFWNYLASRQKDNRINLATLFYYAKENGLRYKKLSN